MPYGDEDFIAWMAGLIEEENDEEEEEIDEQEREDDGDEAEDRENPH